MMNISLLELNTKLNSFQSQSSQYCESREGGTAAAVVGTPALNSGYFEVTSDQPISILALRLTNNQRGDPLQTSSPIADMSSPLAATSLNFPQIADGGGYQTTILLLNTSNAEENELLGLICGNRF
jgi:hypothetical protein